MEYKKKLEKKFSMTICATSPFRREERDLLSQVIIEEIKQGVDIIVDDVFESRNTDEYIMSGSIVSAKRMLKAIEDYFGYKAALKKI